MLGYGTAVLHAASASRPQLTQQPLLCRPQRPCMHAHIRGSALTWQMRRACNTLPPPAITAAVCQPLLNPTTSTSPSL